MLRDVDASGRDGAKGRPVVKEREGLRGARTGEVAGIGAGQGEFEVHGVKVDEKHAEVELGPVLSVAKVGEEDAHVTEGVRIKNGSVEASAPEAMRSDSVGVSPHDFLEEVHNVGVEGLRDGEGEVRKMEEGVRPLKKAALRPSECDG